jgi:hypothetical protein
MFCTTWIKLEAMSTRRSTGTGVEVGIGVPVYAKYPAAKAKTIITPRAVAMNLFIF